MRPREQPNSCPQRSQTMRGLLPKSFILAAVWEAGQ
jgi:hypothetical protein